MEVKRTRIPFVSLRKQNWQRLFTILVVLFFIVVTGIEVSRTWNFHGMGFDYLAFLSGGTIADKQGYGRVYDLELVKQTQINLNESLGITCRPWGKQPQPDAGGAAAGFCGAIPVSFQAYPAPRIHPLDDS